MTGKEMKKLRRDELLQMLIEQTQKGDALEEELALAQAKLEEREIILQKAGTMAEAALRLNAVFQAADEAAAQYLENIRIMETRYSLQAEQLETKAKEQAEAMIAEAAQRCRTLEEETKRSCEEMTAQAQREADSYWNEVSRRLEQYLTDHEELTEWLLRRTQNRTREEKT